VRDGIRDEDRACMSDGSAAPHRISEAAAHPGYSTLTPRKACSDPSCEKTDISRVHGDVDERGEVWADVQGSGERETGWSYAPDVQGSAIVSFISGETPFDMCPFQLSEGCGDGGRPLGSPEWNSYSPRPSVYFCRVSCLGDGYGDSSLDVLWECC
jgi:hypothetical protein